VSSPAPSTTSLTAPRSTVAARVSPRERVLTAMKIRNSFVPPGASQSLARFARFGAMLPVLTQGENSRRASGSRICPPVPAPMSRSMKGAAARSRPAWFSGPHPRAVTISKAPDHAAFKPMCAGSSDPHHVAFRSRTRVKTSNSGTADGDHEPQRPPRADRSSRHFSGVPVRHAGGVSATRPPSPTIANPLQTAVLSCIDVPRLLKAS